MVGSATEVVLVSVAQSLPGQTVRLVCVRMREIVRLEQISVTANLDTQVGVGSTR